MRLRSHVISQHDNEVELTCSPRLLEASQEHLHWATYIVLHSNCTHQKLKRVACIWLLFSNILINILINSKILILFLIHSQFVSHPLAYRLLNERWNYGLPSQCLPGRRLRLLLHIFTIVDTLLTPVLFPVITYVFYKDQAVCHQSNGTLKKPRSFRGLYLFHKTRNGTWMEKKLSKSIPPVLFIS